MKIVIRESQVTRWALWRHDYIIISGILKFEDFSKTSIPQTVFMKKNLIKSRIEKKSYKKEMKIDPS